MADSDKNPSDNETILIALDQISQTIDVMTSVVTRLRTYLEQQEAAAAADKSREMKADLHADRVLH